MSSGNNYSASMRSLFVDCWPALFALLSLSLLLFGMRVTSQASVESEDVNLAGSLRFRSLLAYGITNQVTNQAGANQPWPSVLAKMGAVRADLRSRYPREVAQSDIVWRGFSDTLQRSGRVDWPRALRMRDASDRLTQAIEDAAKRKHDPANALFLAGIGATAIFVGAALIGARNGRRARQIQHAAEQALRESEARFHAFIDQGSIYAWITDEAGTVVYLNAAYCAMIGRTAEECQGKTAFDLYPPEVAREMIENIHQVIQTGKTLQKVESAPLPDGKLHHFLVHKFLLGRMQGRVLVGGSAIEITALKEAEQEQAKFISLIENCSDFVAMVSLDGGLLTMNPAGRRLVGLQPTDEVTAASLSDFIPAGVWEWIRQEVLPAVIRDGRWEGECQLVHAETNTLRDMQSSFFLIRNPVSGEPMCLATMQRDISAQKWLDEQMQQQLMIVQEQQVELEFRRHELATANAHLESLATTDGLTGAKNHRAFQERLVEEVKRAERSHIPLSIILLDVDRFKQYNDQFGHPEGDRVLIQVVKTLHQTARTTDFVARYGGEEFVILLPQTGVEGAIEAAARFRTAIEAEEWPLRPITASFGVATLNPLVQTGQRLVDRADKALYASKAGGRNRVTHADAILIADQSAPADNATV